jgi:hypothetical protein
VAGLPTSSEGATDGVTNGDTDSLRFFGDRVAEALLGGERDGVGAFVVVAVAVGVPEHDPYFGLQPALQYKEPVPQKPNLLQQDPEGHDPNKAPHRPVGNKLPRWPTVGGDPALDGGVDGSNAVQFPNDD